MSHLKSLMVHYSLDFTAYKEASGGFYLRCGTPRTLRKACRGGRGRCKHAQDVAKHAKEAEDVAKHAQELPSKPTHLRFPQGVFWSFFGSWWYFSNFQVLGVFWSFFGFQRYFGHFLDFGGILVIFRFWGVFW